MKETPVVAEIYREFGKQTRQGGREGGREGAREGGSEREREGAKEERAITT